MTAAAVISVEPAVAQAFYDRWLDAWNQDDADRVLAIVTEDFTLSSPTTRLTGHVVADAAATRDYIRYIRSAYPDLVFTQTGPPLFSLETATVAFPWRGTGTFGGRFDPPGIDGTGSSIPSPSRTKTGQIRSPGVNVFSATSARIAGLCRVRRRRVAGKGAWVGRIGVNPCFPPCCHWHGKLTISRVGIAAWRRYEG